MIESLLHRPWLKVVLLLLIICICFAIASAFPALVMALILSLLLAFVLRPLVRFAEIHLGLNRTFSIIIVFILVTVLLLFNGLEGIPVLIASTRELYERFREFPLDQKIGEMARDLAARLPIVNPQTLSLKLRALIDNSIESVGHTAVSAAETAFSFFIIPLVTFFALAQGDQARKRLLERVPNKYFEMTLNVVDKIEKDLIGYLRGWILDSVIVGIISVVGYYLIGINYALLLGIVAGLSNLIPYVGPFVGVIPALLVAVTQTGDLSLIPAVFLFTLIVQTIDNIVVQPVCFSKSVDMHPLTVIVVLIVGNQLMGILGMLLAIPLYTILKVTAVETHWGLKNYRITS